jgi:thiosulfate/3-mercaptopyruvate sulfurtransferase
MTEKHLLKLPDGPLVSSEWLAEHLSAVRVVDVRGKVLPPDAPKPRYQPKRVDYEASHVPGAVFVDWTRDIVDLDDPIPAQIAPPERFARAMEALGIGDDTPVVAYDDYSSMFAGRLAWALRYYGHERVRVLDGGWALWLSEGRPITADTDVYRASHFTPRANAALKRTADEVAAAIGRGALLIDARAPAQFEGKASAASRAGHIPGAKNVHYAKLIDPATGRLVSKDQVKKVFAEAGIDLERLPAEVVCYCNGGVSATVPRMAIAVATGRDDIAIYDGSWNEWGNDPSRPIE